MTSVLVVDVTHLEGVHVDVGAASPNEETPGAEEPSDPQSEGDSAGGIVPAGEHSFEVEGGGDAGGPEGLGLGGEVREGVALEHNRHLLPVLSGDTGLELVQVAQRGGDCTDLRVGRDLFGTQNLSLLSPLTHLSTNVLEQYWYLRVHYNFITISSLRVVCNFFEDSRRLFSR